MFGFGKQNDFYIESDNVSDLNNLPIGCEFKLKEKKYVLQMPSKYELSVNDSITVVGKYFDGNIVIHALNNYSKQYQYKQSPFIRLTILLIGVIVIMFLYSKYRVLENMPSDYAILFSMVIILISVGVLYYVKHLFYLAKINKAIDKLWKEKRM